MAVKFCDKCHRKIELPFSTKNIKVEGEGKIKIKCGYCKKECEL